MRLDFVNVKIFWHGDSNETIFLIFVYSVEPNLSIKRESKLHVKYIEDSSSYWWKMWKYKRHHHPPCMYTHIDILDAWGQHILIVCWKCLKFVMWLPKLSYKWDTHCPQICLHVGKGVSAKIYRALLTLTFSFWFLHTFGFNKLSKINHPFMIYWFRTGPEKYVFEVQIWALNKIFKSKISSNNMLISCVVSEL